MDYFSNKIDLVPFTTISGVPELTVERLLFAVEKSRFPEGEPLDIYVRVTESFIELRVWPEVEENEDGEYQYQSERERVRISPVSGIYAKLEPADASVFVREGSVSVRYLDRGHRLEMERSLIVTRENAWICKRQLHRIFPEIADIDLKVGSADRSVFEPVVASKVDADVPVEKEHGMTAEWRKNWIMAALPDVLESMVAENVRRELTQEEVARRLAKESVVLAGRQEKKSVIQKAITGKKNPFAIMIREMEDKRARLAAERT